MNNKWIADRLFNKIKRVMPIPGATIVIFCEGDVLLLKRAIPPLPGYWTTPGGRIEIGETPEQAARRELKEETGIEGIQLTELKSATFMHNDRQDIVIAFSGQVNSRVIHSNYESSDYTWAPVTDLPSPIHPGTIDIVNDAYQKAERNEL